MAAAEVVDSSAEPEFDTLGRLADALERIRALHEDWDVLVGKGDMLMNARHPQHHWVTTGSARGDLIEAAALYAVAFELCPDFVRVLRSSDPRS